MLVSPSKIKKFLFATIFALASVLPVCAEENVISQVIISKSKDKNHNYELSIDSTQMVQYKSHIDSDGNVYFDLRNSILAQDMGTIYDDVIDIDNVTVKQIDKNHVRIYVNGKNAKNTDLVFINSIFEPKKDASKKIIINRPISEYKSTNYESDLEYEQNAQEWDDNSFNLEHLGTNLLIELKNGPSGKILIVFLLLTILAVLSKTLTSKVKQEQEPLIGLNNSKLISTNQKIGSLNLTPKMLDNDELLGVTNRNEMLKKAQVQLAAAHQKYQQYIQNKYQGTKKPVTINPDILKKSFALNQYQKSTQNPYKNQEVIKMNKGFSDTEGLKGNFQIPPRPKTVQQKTEFTSPYIRRTNNFVDTKVKKEQPNMKFLDSVTKIYERSGRSDLADGLKNSLSKVK